MSWDTNFLQPTCDKCSYLLPKIHDNTSKRPPYIEITMYDHFDDYKEFRKIKENEKKLQKIKEKLLHFNSKFTNFELNKQYLYETIKNLNPQEINKLDDNKLLLSGVIRENKSILCFKKNYKSLSNISITPIQCPVKSCRQIMGIREVLAHFLRDHQQSFPFNLDEIKYEQRSVLDIYPENFKKGEILCLGILAYGANDPKECPGALNICPRNMFLAEYSYLINHLPLIIFASKASICDMMESRKLAYRLSCYRDKMEEVFVIWLSTIETTKKVFCTITAFDESRSMSYSTIHEVRNIRNSQNPIDFLSNSTNYLLLHQGDIKNLSNDGETPILLEIFIHFYDYE